MLGLTFGPAIEVYYLIAAYTLASAGALFAFTRTPLGVLLNAVRDNPQRVAFIGYDPQRVRHLAFVVSGFFAGVAGGLAALVFEFVGPEALGAARSGSYLLFTVLGGTTFFFGPVIEHLALGAMLTGFAAAINLILGLSLVAIGTRNRSTLVRVTRTPYESSFLFNALFRAMQAGTADEQCEVLRRFDRITPRASVRCSAPSASVQAITNGRSARPTSDGIGLDHQSAVRTTLMPLDTTLAPMTTSGAATSRNDTTIITLAAVLRTRRLRRSVPPLSAARRSGSVAMTRIAGSRPPSRRASEISSRSSAESSMIKRQTVPIDGVAREVIGWSPAAC
jgi:hypothetical protein